MDLEFLAKFIAVIACFISIISLFINRKIKKKRSQELEHLKRIYAEKVIDFQHSEPSKLLAKIENKIVELQIQRDLLMAKLYGGNEQKSDDRRKSIRKSILKPVLIKIGKSRILGYITNFSMGGTLIRFESVEAIDIGKELHFEIEGYPLDGRVVHVSSETAATGIRVTKKRQQRTIVQLLAA
jgi:hypothetical protein